MQAKMEITQVSQHVGPIPSPEDLVRYNDAAPDAANRIITMAEKEMEHRHKIEDKLVKNNGLIAVLSLVFCLVSVIILAALVGISIYLGATGAAIGAAIGAIASVAGIFIYAKSRQNKKQDMR